MDGIVQENLIDEPLATEAKRPKTLTVLALLMGVAMVFSWLSAYAFTNALRAAELVTWGEIDPRPRWMLYAFAGIMSVFGICALIFKQVSARQLRRIDEMTDADDTGAPGIATPKA